jgi:spoIIIJ-associated protein
MSSENIIETTGENVEEAIAKGLAELGVTPAEVMVEVLEEASRGVFGIGARPARVRLQLLGGRKPAPPPPKVDHAANAGPSPEIKTAAPSAPKETSRSKSRPPRSETAASDSETRKPAKPRRPRPAPAEEEFGIDEDEDVADLPLLGEADEAVDEKDLDEEASAGKVVLGVLLEKMDVRANIVVRRPKQAADEESVPWVLDITGHNVNRLVGRKGEALAALQYITRLITSRELQHRVNLIVDVEGYKSRRARMLQGLALRMAEEAIERNRTVTLEPMPPHERRIIHMTLRDHESVYTKSVGEGTGRKVTIVPKGS